MARALLTALFLVLPAHADWVWHQTVSPHFAVSHESPWTPPGFVLRLEQMHGRLNMDLSMFSPWMSKERINLFLYNKKDTYLAGEFKPPAWSNGIAMYEKKTVAVYDQPDRKKLMQVVSHETTHLLFEGYWGETGKTPPSWLNEGLAMMEEAESASAPETSDWFRSMVYLPQTSFLPLKDFVKIRPTTDLNDSKDKVSAWYVQAYSVVYFLYRQHTRLQFKNFNSKLRDGQDVSEALWAVYRYADLAAFEKAWRAWLASPANRNRADKQAVQKTSDDGDATKFHVIKGFKSLRD